MHHEVILDSLQVCKKCSLVDLIVQVLMKVDLPVLSNEVCQSWLDLASPSKVGLGQFQVGQGEVK